MKKVTLVELDDKNFDEFLNSLTPQELEKINDEKNSDILFDTVAQATRRIKCSK